MAKTYKLKAEQGDKTRVDEVIVEVTTPRVSETSLARVNTEIERTTAEITRLQERKTELEADKLAIETEAKKQPLI